LAILSKFGALSFSDIFESLAASEIEQVASKHEKNVVFGHFTKIRRFIIFRHFLVTGGFGNRMKTRSQLQIKTRSQLIVVLGFCRKW